MAALIPKVTVGINYPQLRTELVTDPLHLGYSGFLAVNDFVGCANLIGAIGSGASFTIFRNDIQPREVINIIQPTDFASMTQNQSNRLQLLFLGAPIDATLSGVRQNFQNVFSGTATLLSGFLASVAQEQGSRAEVLFGNGISVGDTDILRAISLASGVTN